MFSSDPNQTVRVVRPAVEAMLIDSKAFDLGAWAKKSGYSVRQFHRIFVQLTGETPLAMNCRIRLEKAASELLGTTYSVTRIAIDSGFSSQEAFARAFKARFGVPPSEYRLARFHRKLLPSPCAIHWTNGMNSNFTLERKRPMLQPKILRIAEKRFQFLTHRGIVPDISETWRVVNEATKLAGLDRANSRFFTKCVGPEGARPDEQTFQCGVATDIDGVSLPGFSEGLIPGGTYAVFVHQGPDDLIVDTWSRAFEDWLPSSGYAYGGTCFEEYVNGFYLEPEARDERLIVTAVFVLLKE